MSLRQSFLTKRYSNFFYFNHGAWYIYTHTCIYLRIHAWYIWATVCQSQHEVKTITVCQAFIVNSDGRLHRRRERRAAESSEERETRLAKRRVADRARYAVNSDRRTKRHRERRAGG